MTNRKEAAATLAKDWADNPRWKGIKRGYSAEDVIRLRGSFPIEYTLARRGAEKLWDLLHSQPYVNCLGALTDSRKNLTPTIIPAERGNDDNYPLLTRLAGKRAANRLPLPTSL